MRGGAHRAKTMIEFRTLTLADLVPCADVEVQVYDSAAYKTIFFRQFYDLGPGLLWVATSEGRVVAHIVGALGQADHTGWVMNLAVLAHFRRQGIGRRLMEIEVGQLWQAGARLIRTTSEAENHNAIRLYESLGFVDTGIEANYYGDGRDRRLFELSPKEQG